MRISHPLVPKTLHCIQNINKKYMLSKFNINSAGLTRIVCLCMVNLLAGWKFMSHPFQLSSAADSKIYDEVDEPFPVTSQHHFGRDGSSDTCQRS